MMELMLNADFRVRPPTTFCYGLNRLFIRSRSRPHRDAFLKNSTASLLPRSRHHRDAFLKNSAYKLSCRELDQCIREKVMQVVAIEPPGAFRREARGVRIWALYSEAKRAFSVREPALMRQCSRDCKSLVRRYVADP